MLDAVAPAVVSGINAQYIANIHALLYTVRRSPKFRPMLHDAPSTRPSAKFGEEDTQHVLDFLHLPVQRVQALL